MTMLDVFAFPGLDNSGRLKEYRIESADRARKRISDRIRLIRNFRRAAAADRRAVSSSRGV